MPLRRRKGGRRRQKAPSPCPTEDETNEDTTAEVNQEKDKDLEVDRADAKEKTPPAVDCSMDDDEKKARETIALLSKKYQVSSIQCILVTLCE